MFDNSLNEDADGFYSKKTPLRCKSILPVVSVVGPR